VVWNSVLLAERNDQLLNLVEVVSWNAREQMVFNLPVESSHKPGSESTVNVSSCCDLKFVEFDGGLGSTFVDDHSVVIQSESASDQKSGRSLAQEEEQKGFLPGHQKVHPGDVSNVVENDGRAFEELLSASRRVSGKCPNDALKSPRKTSSAEQRNVEQILVFEHDGR